MYVFNGLFEPDSKGNIFERLQCFYLLVTTIL